MTEKVSLSLTDEQRQELARQFGGEFAAKVRSVEVEVIDGMAVANLLKN